MDEKIRFTILATKRLHKFLKNRAESQGRSCNSQINLILTKWQGAKESENKTDAIKKLAEMLEY